MFKEIEKLIAERPVTIHLSMVDGKISFLVAPKKLTEDENPAFWAPFCGSDTADALDANFASVLQTYVTSRAEVTQSLTSALAAIQAQMKAAADAAKKAAAAKAKKPTTGTAVPPQSPGATEPGDDQQSQSALF